MGEQTLKRFWYGTYLPWAGKTLKMETLAVKTHIVQKFILPELGEYDLRDIDEEVIRQWHGKLLSMRKEEDGEPYSATYLRTIHNQLTAILAKAVEKRIIQANAAISLGSIGDHDGRKVRVWGPETYSRFLLCISSPEMRLMCNLSFWCALRRKEILNLTCEDVEPGGRRITVSLPRPVNPGWTGTPVTLSSPFERRVVDIPLFMQKEMEAARRVAARNSGAPLFHLSASDLNRRMHDAAEAAGLANIGFDGLRDSSMVLLLKAGFQPSSITQHAGVSLQSFERRFSRFIRHDEGMSEKLVQYAISHGKNGELEELGDLSRRIEDEPEDERARTGKQDKNGVRIIPTGQPGQRLSKSFFLDRIRIRQFATWCGLKERARKELSSAGISVLKAINLDEDELAEDYRLSLTTISILKSAFKALGVGKGITKAELHEMGRYRFEDFASFRKECGERRENSLGD